MLSVMGHRLAVTREYITCEQDGCPAVGENVATLPTGTFTAGDVADAVSLHVGAAMRLESKIGRRPAARRPSEA